MHRFVLVLSVIAFCHAAECQTITAPGDSVAAKRLSRLPAAFVPNVGQWQHRAAYVARIGAMSVFLEDNGWTFTIAERTGEKARKSVRGVAVRMTFNGTSAAELAPRKRLPGVHHYFLGSDPEKWRSDVPLYGAVRYRGIQPGVDVLAREKDSHFEYDLMLEPSAKLDDVEITVEGIEGMDVDGDGALVLATALGPVRMPAPPSWEEGASGDKSEIACRYVLRGENRFGFEAPGRRPGWALVVDPGLVWSTFLGGSGQDFWQALALDAQGAATVAGATNSAKYPTTPGAFDTTFSNGEAFVTRLSPSGSSLVFSTFLGGSGSETAYALALDAQGAITVAGSTNSTDFPTTPGAFDTTYNGGSGDAFVARLSPTGSSLIWSTYLGGQDDDSASSLALDAQGTATVVGNTISNDFPTTADAFSTSHKGGFSDVFVTRLAATGAMLVYSTFLGGTAVDTVRALVLDAQGAATVAGTTRSSDFPTTPGAFDTSYNGGFGDAFVARLSPSGSSLVWSTFLGGSGAVDAIWALAVDAQGAATVAGKTDSANFPITAGAFGRTLNGQYSAFVTRLASTGSSLVYSTFLGGTNKGGAFALALDPQGEITVAGRTYSTDFPTTSGAFDTTYNGGSGDAFVTRLSPTGSSLVYSTYLGGTNNDVARSIALDAQGVVTVAGYTTSTNFPTTAGAFDTSYNGNGDAFVTRLAITSLEGAGTLKPGSTVTLALGAPGDASLVYQLGSSLGTGPIKFGSRQIGLSPDNLLVVSVNGWWATIFFAYQGVIGANGQATASINIPNFPVLVGNTIHSAFVTASASAPQGIKSISNTYSFTIQP